MGRGLTEITLTQLASVVGRYNNVIWMSDPDDTDLMKTIIGQPRTVVINLAQLLNLATGDIQGDAIAIDELEATEIADDAVRGRELAETPSLFQTATEVTFDHDTATGAVLVAANVAGGGDRLVICQAEVTETFVSTSWEIDVGSLANSDGLFDNIFAGLATLQINETVAGAYLLPEGEALTVTKTSMVGASAGQLTFRLIVVTPGAKSIPGGLLADDAVGDFETSTTVGVAHSEGPFKQLLAADATNNRLCLVMGVATETAAGDPDIDVGSAVTAINSCFDDISAGAWVIGDRWVGACMLPAGEALVATVSVAGTAGEIDFHVIPLTVVESGTKNLFETVTATVVQDHTDGSQTLLAANAAGGGDRLLIVQAEVTEAFVVATSWDMDVGSTADTEGLFHNIFAGDLTVGVGESVVGVYLLPEGEALASLENDMTGDTAGAITFRINVVAPLAGSIPGALLANDAIGLFENITPTTVTAGGGATQALLALDATIDRLCLVMGIATVAAESGVCDWDVGVTAGNEVFDDISGGTWIAGERWMGACMLPAGAALNVTLQTAGAAGEIDFYVIPLTLNVQTAQIQAGALAATAGGRAIMATGLFDAATALDKIATAAIVGSLIANDAVYFPYGIAPTTVQHDAGGSTELLALDASNDRIVLVTAIATETAAIDPDFDVGAGAGNEVFDDLALGAWVIGERWQGAMVLPAGSALNCTNIAGGSTAGAVDFYVQVLTPTVETAQIADAAITGIKLAATPNLFQDPAAEVTHDHDEAGGSATLLAANVAGEGDRLVVVQCEVTEAFAGVSAMDIDVGSATTPGGLFHDIFGGALNVGLGETLVGVYLLPELEALVTTENTMTGDTHGQFTFRTYVATPAAGSIPGNLLADEGVNFPYSAAAQAVVHDGGNVELLALDATIDRVVLVTAIITESGDGTVDIDVGAGAGTEVFSDLALGDFVVGDRYFGAMVLAAGDALNATIVTAGGSGEIDFYVTVLTPLVQNAQIATGAVDTAELADAAVTGVKLASVGSLFDGVAAAITVIERDYADGTPQQLLAANAGTAGDRLLLVQAHVTEAFVLTSYDWDVGSAANPNGLFDDLFAGDATIGLRESEMSAYWLPAGEALQLLEIEQTDGGAPAGKVTFRILDLGAITTAKVAAGTLSADASGRALMAAGLLDAATALDKIAANAIVGSLIPNDAVGYFEDITPTTVAFGGGATQQILAADANSNRHVLVMAIATVAAESGVCDWDVGVAAGNEVFNDISDGTWLAGERWMGACDLPAGSALNVTLQTAGAAGSIDFYVIALTPLVATANISNDAVTPDKVADIAAESATAGVGLKMAMAEITFSSNAADVGMFGATSIPSGALVMGGYLEVVTALAETNGGGDPDVGLDLEGANDLMADAAWNGAPWNAPGFYNLIPDMTGANSILTTAPRDITVSIVLNGATNILSGVIRVVLFYIEPKTGAV